MKTMQDMLGAHNFFEGLSADYIALIAGCGTQVHVKKDEYVFREGERADAFYVIRHGQVAMELFIPARGPLLIETEGENEVIDFSWLIPPYKWFFAARAVEPVTAIKLDGKCLREKCDKDPVLGYEMMKRFAGRAVERLHAESLRLIDIYKKPEDA